MPLILTASRAIRVPAGAAGVGSAPAWWTSLSAGSWTTVAGSAGQRITDVTPSTKPTDSDLADSNGFPAICNAWTGGCVDQTNRQLIFAANGGHNDYAGNEVYAISLGAETPAWSRIGEPSTNADIANTHDNGLSSFTDGAMKGDHTAGKACFWDGKVWFPMQSAYWSGAGNSGKGIYSWDRTLAAGGAAAAGAWDYYGENASAGDSNGYAFMPSIIDPTTGKIWTQSKYHLQGYFYVDASNAGATAAYSDVSGGSGFIHADGSACVADEIRTWFVLAGDEDTGQQRLVFMDLDTRAWSAIITTGPELTWATDPGKFPATGACYYHDGALYLGAPHSMGGVIRKLVVPLTGSNRPDAAGTWEWSTLANNGTPPTAIGGAGSHNKFNIIRDMGDGEAAFVTCDAITAATYVYKIP